MATLIVFVGLPGSGKSYQLERMVQSGEVAKTRIWPDYHAHSLDGTHQIERSRNFSDVMKALLAGETCAIADIWFCKPGHVQEATSFFKARVPALLVDVRYFANDPASCAFNVRNDLGRTDVVARLQLIEDLAPDYRPPDGVSPYPVGRALRLDQGG